MLNDEFDDETEDDLEDETEEEPDTDPSAAEMVWIQFRGKGSRGPKTAAGHRGRVCLEGTMPRGAVAYLQRLQIGPEAGCCEPFSVWMCSAPGSAPWEQVISTVLTPQDRDAQIDRAEAEHEKLLMDRAAALNGVKLEVRDAELQLEFVKRRTALEQASLERIQQEIEMARATLSHERTRCDEERELLKAERAQRIQERQMLAVQDAAERESRQNQANRAFADLQTLVQTAQEQFKLTLDTNKQTMSALKDGLSAEVNATKGLIQTEQMLQQLIQTAKLNAVTNASELKDQLDQVPAQAPGTTTPVPWLEILDKAMMGIAVVMGKVPNPMPT